MRTDIGVLFLSAILLLIRAEISHIHGSDEDYFLRDDDGRTRFFHGLNYVQKGFPWYPVALLNKTRCKELAANGFNAIRLGVMWSGAQPTASGFNQTYYDIIGEIVDNLAEAGMYTLFDMHQVSVYPVSDHPCHDSTVYLVTPRMASVASFVCTTAFHYGLRTRARRASPFLGL
eukprot:m.53451 g.53451  ORF g.53451 m.53451 type:complete len:174 (-) comp13565_c0_seq1:1081-1602(-)